MDEWSPIARVYDPLKAGSIDGTDSEPHDHGVVRAMQAHHKPNKLVVGDPKRTIFVAKLNPDSSEETLEKVFSRYGDVLRCRLVRDIVTGFSKCYGFVEFKDTRGAARAHRDANRVILDNHEIFVDYECGRTLKGWIPRRLGGGFGGKKESGQLRFGGRQRPFKEPILVTMERNRNRPDFDQEPRPIKSSNRDGPRGRGHQSQRYRRNDYGRHSQQRGGYKDSRYSHY